MSLGTILIIIVILYLLGGWSGRFGGYGYGLGHSGMGLGGVIWSCCWSCFCSGNFNTCKPLKLKGLSIYPAGGTRIPDRAREESHFSQRGLY